MRSIERRFNNIAKRNPCWSSYICFAEAVEGQSFSKQTISRWFQKLVDKKDYSKSDKKGILVHLDTLTNTPRTTKNKGKPPA